MLRIITVAFYIDTGCLTVTRHRAAALYSEISWVNWLQYVALAEKPPAPVAHLNNGLHGFGAAIEQ